GLPMTVVQADGEDVRPVETDELQIANAETYDIIVRPAEDRAYALVAEAADRSGMAVGTLSTRAGVRAQPPPLRERPVLTMRDMGMDMSGDHADHADGGHGGGMREPANAPQVDLNPGVQMISPMP